MSSFGSEDALVAEAQAFMESYATDLREGRRDAIIERYDPRGTYFMGHGQKRFVTLDGLKAIYHGTQWQPPVTFAWRDMSYEPVGPDAVVMIGLIDWGLNPEVTIHISYTGLLLRRDGRWMIRLEDEDAAPQRRAPQPQPQAGGEQ